MADANSLVTQAGHLVRILAGGLEVGWARSAQMTQDFGTDGVYSIGNVGPTEHAPLRWSGQITLDEFVIHQNRLGQAVQAMDLVAIGPEEILRQGVIDFEILDAQDAVIMVYQQCTPVNLSYSVQANAFSGQNTTFMAKSVTRGAGNFDGDVQLGRVGKPS